MDNIQSANRPVSSPINYDVIASSSIREASPNVAIQHQQQQHNYLGVQNRYGGGSTFSNFGQESSEPSSLTTSITTTTSTTTATNQLTRQSPLSPAESIMNNPENIKHNRAVKTEYKENFKPFDQYVYNEFTDTFVRGNFESQNQSKQDLISTPNQNIKSSISNQDITQSPMHEQNLLSLQNTHDASTFEPNQAQSSSDKTNGAASNSIASEPWYKEVIKRNERANEYRFKSELGHNSNILNYVTNSTGNNTDSANKNQAADSEADNTAGGEESIDNKQAVQAASNLSTRQPVVYRYKRDNMIAQMAKNNNFKLPKEPADTVNSSTNRVRTPVNASAAPSHLRPLTRSTAQSRARSQSSRRPVSTTPNGCQNSQTTKKADSTNTTPTRTPTYVTSKGAKVQSNLPGTPRPSPATVASSKLAANRRALNSSASSATTPTSVNVRDTSKRVATAKPPSSALNSKSGSATRKPTTTQTTPNTQTSLKTNSVKNSIPAKPRTPITASRNTPNGQANARIPAVSKTTTNKQLNSANKPVPVPKQLDSPTSVKSNRLSRKDIAPLVCEIGQVTKPLDDIVTSSVSDDLLDNKQKRISVTSGNSENDSNDIDLTRGVELQPQVPHKPDQVEEKSTEKSELSVTQTPEHSPETNDDLPSDSKTDDILEPILSSTQMDEPVELELIVQSKKFSLSQASQNDLNLRQSTSDIQSPPKKLSDEIEGRNDPNESIAKIKPGQHDDLILSPHQLADLSNEYLTHKTQSETSETSSDSTGDSQEDASASNLHDEIKHAMEERVGSDSSDGEQDKQVVVEDESDRDTDENSVSGVSTSIKDKPQQQEEQQQQEIEEEIKRKSSGGIGLGADILKNDAQPEIKNVDTQDTLNTSGDLMGESEDELDTTDEIVEHKVTIDKPKVEELILSPMQLADLSNDNVALDDFLETPSDANDHPKSDQARESEKQNQEAVLGHSETKQDELINEQQIPEPIVEEFSEDHENEIRSGQVESDVHPMMLDNDEDDDWEGKHLQQYMDDNLKNNMPELISDNHHDLFYGEAEKPREFDTTPIESEEQIKQILDEIDGLKMDISDYIASKEPPIASNLDIEKPAPIVLATDPNLHEGVDTSASTNLEKMNENNLLGSDTLIAETKMGLEKDNISGTTTSINEPETNLNDKLDLGGMDEQKLQKDLIDDMEITEPDSVSTNDNKLLIEDPLVCVQAKRSSIDSKGQDQEEEPYSILQLESKLDELVQQQPEGAAFDMLLDFSGTSSNLTDVSKIVHPDSSPLNPIDLMEPEKADMTFSVDHPMIEEAEMLENDHVSSEKIDEHKEEGIIE